MAVKWYAKSIPEVEELQSTNATNGIPKGNAALRLKRDGENRIFKLPDDSFKHSLLSVMSGFAFILLFLAVAIYAFYDGGIASGIISVLYIAFVAAASLGNAFAKNKIYKAAEKSLPKIHVVRSGKDLYIDMRSVVRGDVIVLGSGDIVPCDMYITEASDELYVIEGRITGVRTPVRKGVGVILDDGIPTSDQANMLFASSVIRSGFCRGIAVEVGRSCEVVRAHGEVPIFDGGSPRLEGELREFSSKGGFRLLMVGILVIILGFFHNDGGLGLFMNFFAAVALCASTVSEMPDVIFNIVTASEISHGMKNASHYLIKNEAAIESIATLNTLIIKSDVLRSDGTYEAVAFATADETLPAISAHETRSRGMRYFLECSMISSEYISADYKELGIPMKMSARYATGVYSSLVSLIGEHRHYGALMSRPADSSFPFDTVVLQGSKSSFAVATGNVNEILESCNRYVDNGRIIPIDSSVRSRILSFANNAYASGFKVVAFARSDFDYKDLESADGIHRRMQFIGCVSLRERASDDVVSFLRGAAERGIKVLTLHDASPAELYALLGTIPGYENASVLDGKTLTARGRELDPSMVGYDIYIGLTPLQKERLVRTLSSLGRRVGVLAEDFGDYRMMFSAEATFVCGEPQDFSSRVKTVNTNRCNAVLREADAIVDKSVRALGAIIDAATKICAVSGTAIKYMTLMLAYRCVLVLIGSVFGVTYLTPLQILYLSLVVDSLCVLTAYFGTKIEHTDKAPPRVTFRYFEELLPNAGAVCAAAVLAPIVPVIFAIARVPMSEAEMCGFVFVTSLAVSVYNLLGFMKPAFNRVLTIAFCVTLALPVVLMLIPAMSAAFGTVLSLKVIASAALSFAVCMIAGLVFKRRFAKATRINKRKTKPIEK